MSEHDSVELIEKDGEIIQPKLNEFAQKFLEDLLDEKQRLSEDLPLCAVLIDEAVQHIYSTGRVPGRDFYADVFRQKPLKVIQKVYVPVKQYPKFNFNGKILGPKGNSLRRLQEETQCKIAIKGRHSIRDHTKEEELRNSGDPKYAHFNKPLYLEISTVAPPAECYARIAYALAEIRKYIIPDKNDEVSKEQLREMLELHPETSKSVSGGVFKSVLDRKASVSNGTARYISLLKKTSNQSQEEPYIVQEVEEERNVYEYPKRYVVKRPGTYEYGEARPSLPTQKRSQPTVIATEIKRPREDPATPHKVNPYAIFKKYR